VDGGHAEWAMCRAQQLHRLPDGASDDAAATAEPLAVVRERVEEAVALASAPMDWEFSCWVVATPGV